ncbi:MAG: hypothetical protein J6D42_09740 [Clostridia bacterium]|nr:hypothetical protein [Clostridia bacterium]
MKTTNRFLLTLTFFTVLVFILSSCSEPIEKTDPNTVNDPEKIESAVSDPIREQPALTDIAVDENLRAAYDAICNYQPYRMTNFTDAKHTVYRTSKITFDDLDPEYVLSLAYDILPEREREKIIGVAGVYSPYGYRDGEIISGWYDPEFLRQEEVLNEDIEYTVYPVEELDGAVKKLFGESADIEYQTFFPGDGDHGLVYDGTRFLEWETANGDGFFGFSDFSILLYAETDGEFVYVTDKFISFDYGSNKDGFFIVNAMYSDGAQSDLIFGGDDVPFYYRETRKHTFGNTNPSVHLFYGRFPGLVSLGDYMQTYKHTFKLSEDGTYFWVSSEPFEDPEPLDKTDSDSEVESDSNKEQLPLTEIPFEGNLEAAYEAICNFKPLRFSMFFTELKFSVYRPSKITFEDLDPEYYLALAYDLIPEREREIIIEDAGIYSDSAYISGEYITEDIEYTVYTADEVEKAVKTLFGEDVSFEHQKFQTTGPYSLVYDGKKYLGYDSNMDGDPCLTDYSVVLKAETDGEFVYITDKFASFDYDFSGNGYDVVSAIYSDGGQTNLLHSGDDIPYDYRTPNLYDYPPVNNLLWGDSLDFEVFGDLMQTYKHTFKLAEDGTYFWVSSEPITD